MSAFCILEQQMIITACTLPPSLIQMNIEISFRKKKQFDYLQLDDLTIIQLTDFAKLATSYLWNPFAVKV